MQHKIYMYDYSFLFITFILDITFDDISYDIAKTEEYWKTFHEINEFPYFFGMGTFIDSTPMKLYPPFKYSPPAPIHVLYRSNKFWKAPSNSSCVSVSITFLTATFISSILSLRRQPLTLRNNQKSQGARSGR